jgi:fatty acid desaturase
MSNAPRPAEVTGADLRVRRKELVDNQGRSYFEFRRELSPRWGAVWAWLLGGHLALFGSVCLVAWVDGRTAGWAPSAAVAACGAAAIGFWLHYLLLFQHEGVHYNLAPNHSWNDRLTNAFVGIFIGEDVRVYRPIHLEHHRWLGTTRDTERSYFERLDLRFVLQGMFGVRLVKALLTRRRLFEGQAAPDASGSRYLSLTFVVAAAVNGTIVVVSWWLGYSAVAIAWCAGELGALPLFNTLRQLLEHRSEQADGTADYSRFDHGVVNRIFGAGPFATVFGAAGFNRHLLHHWDPGVSFTRLADVERFILDSEFAGELRSRTTTYSRALRALAFR